ncbi:MAG: 16S rRNA (guanine(527)-N(7))-methyltransferase RsmG [Eubacterium sp.]|nr:16S rRNA (guanine(527)-N(7))-methyltransferase RsmG [Eubacterium sp.]
MKNKFFQQLERLDIHLSEKQEKQFYQYYELLVKWNKVMNLTAIVDYKEVQEKHFIDSLSLVKMINIKSVHTLIDVGTGAGFPGLPLKIVFPHLEVILLDSLQKRILFLNEVIHDLGLFQIEAKHGRAEDYAKDVKYRENFDLCVSRAVADLSVLSEYCIPFVKIGGKFISYKSDLIDEEVKHSENAIHILGGNIQKIEKFQLPESEIKRSFISISKERTTNKRYPRKAGIPLKKPLD